MQADDTNLSKVYRDAEILWHYHHLGHRLEPCSVGIGMGSLDLEVAVFTAELFKRGLFPLVVFTGAVSQVTRDRFPRGEAVHYREEAIRLGVPDHAILLETRATKTEENVLFSRQLLYQLGVDADSVLFICRPSQERRALAIANRTWPGARFVCTSPPMTLTAYVASRGSAKAVIDMLVGDTQRVMAELDVVHGNVTVPEAPPRAQTWITGLPSHALAAAASALFTTSALPISIGGFRQSPAC